MSIDKELAKKILSYNDRPEHPKYYDSSSDIRDVRDTKDYQNYSRGYSEIIPNLYIGEWSASFSSYFTQGGAIITINWERSHSEEYVQMLKENGVTFLDFRVDDNTKLWKKEDYKEYKEYMESTENYLHDVFDRSYTLISKNLRHGGRVLVHCTAGINRSATVVINYIMRVLYQRHSDLISKFKVSSLTSQVLKYITSRRHVIWPSTAMMTHLLAAECEYIDQYRENLEFLGRMTKPMASRSTMTFEKISKT